MSAPYKHSSCKQCGKCCYYEIPITLYDISRLAEFLGYSPKYVFTYSLQPKVSALSGLYMIRKDIDRSCVFMNDRKQCKVNAAKPLVCALFDCNKARDHKILPWTATCHDEDSRTEVWRQSIAVTITRSYIEKHGVSWDGKSWELAIAAIERQAGRDEKCKVKLSKDADGHPLAMIYSCETCEHRTTSGCESLITLDDIERISKHMNISVDSFFERYVDSAPSSKSGSLKLKRDVHCIFYDENHQCGIEQSRPIHCRFTPCPSRVCNDDMMDRLYLGSGTLEQQFRHQLALEKTRLYVCANRCTYSPNDFRSGLTAIEREAKNKELFHQFCRQIMPFRYLEDMRSVGM